MHLEKASATSCKQPLSQEMAEGLVSKNKAELNSLPDFMPFRVQTKLIPSGCKKGDSRLNTTRPFLTKLLRCKKIT
jgi:hypothetical protein